MKILFYGTKNYDEEFFEKLLPSYPGITIKFTEANIHEETASLAKGYEAICAFVNADLSTPVIEELNAQGVKLILMRCAGYNNVDLETAHKFGMKVLRVPGYSPEAVAEHAMALALTANRHTHKAYIKCRENNFSLSGLMGLNFYQKTAGIIGTGKIGQAMAKICKGFGMRVIAYDLFPNKNLDYLEYVSLDAGPPPMELIIFLLSHLPRRIKMAIGSTYPAIRLIQIDVCCGAAAPNLTFASCKRSTRSGSFILTVLK